MNRLKIGISGVSETHWTRNVEESFEEERHVIIHSCRNDNIHRQGVAIILTKEISEFIKDYQLISERMMSLTLDFGYGPITLVQVYAPDSSYSDIETELFYEKLQECLDSIPRKNKQIILGDFNAKVGRDAYVNWPESAGMFSIGDTNEPKTRLIIFLPSSLADLLLKIVGYIIQQTLALIILC